MTESGAILLVACYELGHPPLAVAWPAAFLERLGYRPATLDVSVEPFDAEAVKRARLVAISVPMHTALRLGVAVAERVRAVNPGAHLCFFGLYATLNADFLLAHGADTVIGGEAEGPLAELARALAGGEAGPVPGVSRAGARAGPYLAKLPFPVPSRAGLPSLKKYAHLERDGGRELAGCGEASLGCCHHCRLIPGLAALGCAFIVSAVESLSDAVLAHLDKGHTRADVHEAVGLVRAVGVALRPTWVPFTPWSTLDDYREMLDFVADEGLVDHVDPVQYSIRLLVPPGSLLLASPAMRPFLGPLVERDFYYRWTHPDPRMDGLQGAVQAAVARAAESAEDPVVTFDRVRALAQWT